MAKVSLQSLAPAAVLYLNGCGEPYVLEGKQSTVETPFGQFVAWGRAKVGFERRLFLPANERWGLFSKRLALAYMVLGPLQGDRLVFLDGKGQEVVNEFVPFVFPDDLRRFHLSLYLAYGEFELRRLTSENVDIQIQNLAKALNRAAGVEYFYSFGAWDHLDELMMRFCDPRAFFTSEAVAVVIGKYIADSFNTEYRLEHIPGNLPTYRLSTEQGSWRLEIGAMVMASIKSPALVGTMGRLGRIFLSLLNPEKRCLPYPYSQWFLWEGLPERKRESPLLQCPDCTIAAHSALGQTYALLRFKNGEAYWLDGVIGDIPTDDEFTLVPTMGETPADYVKPQLAGRGPVLTWPDGRDVGTLSDTEEFPEYEDHGDLSGANPNIFFSTYSGNIQDNEIGVDLDDEALKAIYDTPLELNLTDDEKELSRVYEPPVWDTLESDNLIPLSDDELKIDVELQSIVALDSVVGIEMARRLRLAHLQRFFKVEGGRFGVSPDHIIAVWACPRCQTHVAKTLRWGERLVDGIVAWRGKLLEAFQEIAYGYCPCCGRVLQNTNLTAFMGAHLDLAYNRDIHWVRHRDNLGDWRESWGFVEYEDMHWQKERRNVFLEEVLTEERLMELCGHYSSWDTVVQGMIASIVRGLDDDADEKLSYGSLAVNGYVVTCSPYAQIVFGAKAGVVMERPNGDNSSYVGAKLTVVPRDTYVPQGWPEATLVLRLGLWADQVREQLQAWGHFPAEQYALEWYSQRGERGGNGTRLILSGPDTWASIDIPRLVQLCLIRHMRPDEMVSWTTFLLSRRAHRVNEVLTALRRLNAEMQLSVDIARGWVSLVQMVDGKKVELRINLAEVQVSEDPPEKRAAWMLSVVPTSGEYCACGERAHVSLKVAPRAYWMKFDRDLINQDYVRKVLPNSDRLLGGFVLRCPYHTTELKCSQWKSFSYTPQTLWNSYQTQRERFPSHFFVHCTHDSWGRSTILIGGNEAGALLTDPERLAGTMEAANLPFPEHFMVWAVRANLLIVTENMEDTPHWQEAESAFWQHCPWLEPTSERWNIVQRGKAAEPKGIISVVLV